MKRNKTYFALALFAGLMTLSATPATGAAAKTVAEQKLPNQLRNGKFDLVTKKGIAADWSFWKKDESQAKVQIEKKAGVDQSSAAVFSGGSCSYFTWAKVQGGEKIYAKIKTRKTGEGGQTGKKQTGKTQNGACRIIRRKNRKTDKERACCCGSRHSCGPHIMGYLYGVWSNADRTG